MTEINKIIELNKKRTPGDDWEWIKVDYKEASYMSSYEIDKDGPFDSLWNNSTNKPVFVAQDLSAYSASCDFPNQSDAEFLAAAPQMVEIIIEQKEKIEELELKCRLRGKEIRALKEESGRKD